jgi:hypothetical protein
MAKNVIGRAYACMHAWLLAKYVAPQNVYALKVAHTDLLALSVAIASGVVSDI